MPHCHTLTLPLYNATPRTPSTLWLRLLIISLLLTLHGCTLFQSPTAPPPPTGTQIDWVQHMRSLTLLQEWQLKGKIGVRTHNDAGSAYIDWSQSQDSFYINLSGPLGQGSTIISGNPSGARLEQSDGTFIAESPDQLVLEHTGWEIPINNLLYWVKGMPAPTGMPEMRYNQIGTLASLEQDGWALQFDQYGQLLGTLLPQKIRIQKGELKVTLIIKNWLPLSEEEAN